MMMMTNKYKMLVEYDFDTLFIVNLMMQRRKYEESLRCQFGRVNEDKQKKVVSKKVKNSTSS